MIYKCSFILQHTTLNKPKHDSVSLTLERRKEQHRKKTTCSQRKWGSRVEERKKKKAATRTQAAGTQGLGRTSAPQQQDQLHNRCCLRSYTMSALLLIRKTNKQLESPFSAQQLINELWHVKSFLIEGPL